MKRGGTTTRRAARPKRATKARTAKGAATSTRAARAKPKRVARTRTTLGAAKPRGAAARTARTKPALRAVAGRKRRAPPPPAFPQTVGASTRNELLFRMVKARASVLAAIQGMSAATAERPLGADKWSTRETVLHLVTRDRARLREMEAALRGIRPSWDGSDPERQARVNEEDLAPLRDLGWEDAVRLLHTTRQQLMEAVESIPEEPAEVWAESHPLGWMFHRLPPHDLHHADVIKRWRTEHGA